jgi:hypothetical protein
MNSNTKVELMGHKTQHVAKKIASVLLFAFAIMTPLFAAEVYAETITLIPNEDGHLTEFGVSSGTIHSAAVNDSSNITYVYATSKSIQDFWGIYDHGSESGTINNVTVFLTLRHSAGNEEFRFQVYVNGTESDNGADIADSSSWTTYQNTWALNPATGETWQWGEIDDLEIGVLAKAIGKWSPQLQVSEALVVVDYSLPLDPPDWTNPQVNDSDVYTGEAVNHSVDWTDEGLSGFIFSWNATGTCDSDTWVNSTWQPMTGASGTAFNISTIPQACANKTIGWRIYANDTNNQWNVTDIQTYGVTGYGWLEVSLLSPVDPSLRKQNSTFWVNATVTCQGPAGAECGTVEGGVRYNASSSQADTLIDTTQGATPFYVVGGPNQISCHHARPPSTRATHASSTGA